MEISELSHWDYIQLIGHYIKLSEKESIDPNIYDRGFTEAQIAAMEEKVNSSNKSRQTTALGLRYSGNFDRFNYGQFDFMMLGFQAYDNNGVLPFQGSLSEQPAQTMEIFSVLEQLKYENLEKQRKKQEREQKAMRKKRV